MKDASDQPVSTEAKPLVVGGEAKQPTRRKLPWVRIVVVLVVLAAIGAGVWWFVDQKANYLNISRLDSSNTRIAQAQELAKKPVPKDAKEKSTYYATIATYLQSAKEYTYAEHFLLTAQKVNDDNNLDKKEYRYYIGLADIYKKLGNQKKADEYNQKEQKFLEANYSKEVLDQMKAVKSDAPREN